MKKKDNELLDQFNERFIRMKSARTNWERVAEENFAFYAGHQWDSKDEQALKEQRRPVVTFNKMKKFVNVVMGVVLQNKGEPHYLPRTPEDRGLNNMMNSAALWAREEANSEFYEIYALTDMLVTGMGCTNEFISYDDNPDGKLKKERVYPMDIWTDNRSVDINYLDARDLIRLKRVTSEELEDMFDLSEEDMASITGMTTPSNTTSGVVDAREEFESTAALNRAEPDEIHLYEYCYREKVPYYRMKNPISTIPETDESGNISPEATFMVSRAKLYDLNPQNAVWSLTPKQFSDINDGLEALGVTVESVKDKRWKYYRAFIANDFIVEHDEAALQSGFSYKFITGLFDEEEKYYAGIVGDMKDPARYQNKAFSQWLHVINSNPKGGLFVKKGQEDVKKLERDYASGTSIIEVKDPTNVQEKKSPMIPTGLPEVMQVSTNAFMEVTGINMELLGQRNAAQAGILESQRIQQGMTALAPYMNPFRLYMKETGRSMVEFIRELTENVDGRLIRIIGEGDAKYAPLLKDDLVADYDIIIEEVKNEANQDREDLKALTMAAQNGLIDTNNPVYKQAVLELMPMREELKQQALQANKEQSEQEAAQRAELTSLQQQLEMTEKQLEFANTDADTEKKRADALKSRAEAAEKSQEVVANQIMTGIKPAI